MAVIIRKLQSTALLLLASVALLVTFEPTPALGQPNIATIQANTMFVYWDDQDSSRTQSTYYTVRAKECAANTSLNFELTVGAPNQTSPLEVWAGLSGTNCGDVNIRADSTKRCYKLFSEANSDTQLTLKLQAQSLVQVLDSPNGSFVMGDANSCKLGQDATLTLYFFHNGGSDNAGNVQSFNISVNLTGPAPPTGLSAVGLDNRIRVDWSSTPASGSVGSYRVYCQPATGAECDQLADAPAPSVAAVDTGDGGNAEDAGGTGGADVAVESPANGDAGAGSGGLKTGEIPSPDLQCGTEGSLSLGVSATGLENGQLYMLGVAAVDTAGNVGRLSELQCASPQHATDFWEAYKAAGGRGGGGFCALTTLGRPLRIPTAGFAGLLMLAVGITIGYRRRK